MFIDRPIRNLKITLLFGQRELSNDLYYFCLQHAENCNVSPSYHSRQSFTAPNICSFQPIRSYYGPGLYDRGYFPPSIYHGSPLPLGIRQEDPSSFWGFEEEWKWNRGNAVAGNQSKY